MAVRAHHVTLRHLSENRFPVAVPDSVSKRKGLVFQMVEFQNDHVVLPAIYARVLLKELDESSSARDKNAASSGGGIRDVSLTVV